MSSIYDFSALDIDGRETALSLCRGKVILIGNTASKCGFTPQFGGLESLSRDLGAHGLGVLGFPCNQFGGREPGNEPEIARFCPLDYQVSFSMFSKVDVNGDRQNPPFA